MGIAEGGARNPPEVPAGCNVPVSGPIDLRGKVAIVTGARSGIGQAASLALARAGARVAVSDLAASDETLARVKAWDPGAVDVEADVTRGPDCDRLALNVLERFGRIDILVCSAGVLDLT